MRVGVIGGGIVGSAIAATIKRYHPTTTKVTIIDDKHKRPHQTSQAGQGYLWSIHRCVDINAANANGPHENVSSMPSSLEYSLEAKEAWLQLLGDCAESLLQKRGSLLVAPSSSKEQLEDYHEIVRHLLGSTDVTFLPDASTCNPVLLPSVCGIYYKGNDYTCNPPLLIDALMEMYDIDLEYRTVTVESLKEVKENFDCVICCTGPWIKELNHNLNVEPVRGVLMQLSPGSRTKKNANNYMGVDTDTDIDQYIPMMEFGYGSLGIHFTLSPRNGLWLLGASREEVDFSTDGLEDIMKKLVDRSHQFVHSDTFGPIHSSKIGFRPAHYDYNDTTKKDKIPFQIKCEDDVIFCYGFEGEIGKCSCIYYIYYISLNI